MLTRFCASIAREMLKGSALIDVIDNFLGSGGGGATAPTEPVQSPYSHSSSYFVMAFLLSLR